MNATVNASTNTEAIRAAAVVAEGQRRNQIRASFKLHLTLPGVAELLSRCEQNAACTAEAAGLQLLAHIGAGATPIMGSYVPSYSQDTRMGDLKAAAQDVLLTRAGLKVGELHPGVRDLRRMGVVGLAEAILTLGGRSVRDLSPAGIISAAMSTSDFPSLLAATAGKALAIGYQSAPSGHAKFTGERDVPDFKSQTLVNLSQAPSLEVVNELGEYKNGGLSDGASTFQLTTFGKIISISRQALVNDDLASFTILPQTFGAAASRLEADKVFGLLTANANLTDGFALFSAQHGNLGAAAALSVASLGLARAAMRQQKGISGVDFIDLKPKYLIVPVGLETTAEQLIASLVDPSRNNNTPSLEFIKNLELIADPRLDAASATAWYLATSPGQSEGILRAYLAGEARPNLEEDSEFRRDAISYKVRLDFAAGVMEYRALYKNPGL